MIPPEVYEEAGAALGVYADGQYAFPDEIAMGVLADSCLHDWPDREGRSIVARYAESVAGNLLPEPERVVLDALLRSRYAHFRVEETLPGVGARVRSAIDDREFTLLEPLLDRMPDGDGLWWLGRLMFPAGRCMTTGTPVLVGRSGIADPEEQLARLRRVRPKWRSDRDMAISLASWAVCVLAERGKPEDELRIPEGEGGE